MADDNGLSAAKFRGMAMEKLANIEKNQDEIKETIALEISKVHKRLNEHNEYHEKNEYRWGFWTLLKRKPLLAILFGLIVGGSLFSMGFNFEQIIELGKAIK